MTAGARLINSSGKRILLAGGAQKLQNATSDAGCGCCQATNCTGTHCDDEGCTTPLNVAASGMDITSTTPPVTWPTDAEFDIECNASGDWLHITSSCSSSGGSTSFVFQDCAPGGGPSAPRLHCTVVDGLAYWQVTFRLRRFLGDPPMVDYVYRRPRLEGEGCPPAGPYTFVSATIGGGGSGLTVNDGGEVNVS